MRRCIFAGRSRTLGEAAALALLPLLALGCPDDRRRPAGGSGSTTAQVSGSAVDGRVANGSGTIHAVAADGAETEVGTLQTDANGVYQVSLVAPPGVVRLRLTSGSYVDGASGQTLQLDAQNPLEAVVNFTGAPLEVHLTPLTTVASRLLDEITGGASASVTAAVIDQVNTSTARAFGLTDASGNPIDVTTLAPLDLAHGPDAAAFATDPGDPRARYGLLVGALAQVAASGGLSVPEAAAALAADAADGVLDGRDAAGSAITGLDGGSATTDLAAGIAAYLAAPHVAQTFTGQGLAAPDAAAIPEVQALAAEVAQNPGTVDLPPDPDAPTPASIALLGLSSGFINATTDEASISVVVGLPAGALAGDEIALSIAGAQGAPATRTATVDAAAIAATSISFASLGTDALADGTIRFTATLRRTSAAGTATSVAVSTTVPKDEAPATVHLTAPAPGAFAGASPLTIRASASGTGSGIASVELRVGIATVATDTAFPFEAAFDASALGLADGPYDVTAIARDQAGNAPATSTPAAIVVDRTAPSATADVASGLVSQTFSEVTFMLADAGAFASGPDTAATQVTVTLDDGTGPRALAAGELVRTEGADTVRVAIAAPADGAYALRATPRDRAGNLGTILALTATRDTTAPTGAITSPAASAIVSGSLAAAATAQDAVGVDQVTFTLSDSLGGSASETDGAAPFTAALDTTGLANGAGTLTISTRDTAGNVRAVAASITVTIANGAPAITSAAPGTATVGQLYSYTIATTGAPVITLSVSGNPAWLTLAGNVLSGTPAAGDVGTTGTITIVATNGVAPDATEQLTIIVAPSGAPAITSTAPGTATVGQLYSYTIVATGTPAITLTVSGNPTWLTLAGSVLSGTPAAGDVGTTGTITITATNGVAPDATEQLTIAVASAGSGAAWDSAVWDSSVWGN